MKEVFIVESLREIALCDALELLIESGRLADVLFDRVVRASHEGHHIAHQSSVVHLRLCRSSGGDRAVRAIVAPWTSGILDLSYGIIGASCVLQVGRFCSGLNSVGIVDRRLQSSLELFSVAKIECEYFLDNAMSWHLHINVS